MPDPKKPTAIEQMVEILRTMVHEPISDQSSRPATAADVRNVKAALNPPTRRKAAKKPRPKPRPKPATKKKRATTKRKAAPKTASRKKSTARK